MECYAECGLSPWPGRREHTLSKLVTDAIQAFFKCIESH